MHPFWRSKSGKLLIGGCGTQLGLLFSGGALTALLLVCAVCAGVNLVSAGLVQQAAQGTQGLQPTPAVRFDDAPPAQNEVQLLNTEVDLLLSEIEQLQAAAPAGPAPAPRPAAGEPPRVVANQADVNLRSGPGVEYSSVGVLPVGQTLKVTGRNPESSWWLVELPSGLFAWVADRLVSRLNITEAVPVVTLPSQQGQPAASFIEPIGTPQPTPTPSPTPSPTPLYPPGTPTPGPQAARVNIEEIPTYKRFKDNLLQPPTSFSFSPDGKQFAASDRIKLYTVGVKGGHTNIWLEDNDFWGPMHNVTWSPDGKYLAFVVGFKNPKCRPCRSVGILRLDNEFLLLLEAPDQQETDAPRWTQDGRLLINVHRGEPADGVAYEYDVLGREKVASGLYLLSASHFGQRWHPWLPGKLWRAGTTERADSYNSD